MFDIYDQDFNIYPESHYGDLKAIYLSLAIYLPDMFA